MNEFSDAQLLELLQRLQRAFCIEEEDPEDAIPCTTVFGGTGSEFGSISDSDAIDVLKELMHVRCALEEELG